MRAPDSPTSPLRPWLATLVVIAVVAALKATQAVTMPLAFALFLTLLFWPLQDRLRRSMPRWAAFGLTFLAFLAALTAFGGALYYAAAEVVDRAPEYREEWERVRGMLPEPVASSLGAGGEVGDPPQEVLKGAAAAAWTTGALFVLTVAFFALALLEVRPFQRKLTDRFEGSFAHSVADGADEVAQKVLSYVGTRAFTSGLTGVLSWGVAAAVGLDFAFVWGLLSFLLNFVPTLGSIVAIVPPTLFALFQFGMAWQVGAVLGGFVLVQVVLGSFVDPKLQGKNLQLSPLVVLFSIAFWGWVWGIGGALLGVPLTVTLVIACDHFEETRWVADLLTSADEDRSAQAAAPERADA